MTTQIFHNRLGHIQLQKLHAADHPKTVLSLVSCQEARAFMGTVGILEYGGEYGNLFHYRYNFQPAVDLVLRDDNDGLKILIMLEGSVTLKTSVTPKMVLSDGKACIFRAREYQVGLSENCKVEYLLFSLDTFAMRMEWHDFRLGAFDLPFAMKKCRTAIMKPSGIGTNPRSWLSLQMTNLIFYTRKGINAEEPRYGVKKPLLELAYAADEFMHHNLASDITAKETAKAIGTNLTYLNRAYKENFNMSFGARLMMLRLEQAKELLQQTSMPINVVASECGWQDGGTFRKNFFNKVKINPSVWREKHKL